MNPQRSTQLIRLDGGVRGLLTFEWHHDRYRHAWSFDDSQVRIQSIESSSDEVWPSSPPLQQIHSQSFGDGREVIFGVGMAGRGHWSASFTLVPDLKCWIVELACRCSAEPEQLLSCYELVNARIPSDPAEIEPECLMLDPDQGISIEPICPGTMARLEGYTEDAGHARLRLAPVQSRGTSATTQWAFRLRVP